MKLDTIDKAILNRIQSDFPIEPRPYEAIARELGLTERQVLQRVQTLKSEGIIRRIGGNFVPHKVGFVSTLCAAKVPEDQIDAFAAVVNKYTGVTHNYQRENAYNIWFTFIAPSREEIAKNLANISRETGVTTILNLPATRVFKIRAQFDV
jgi:DNA-binding Lrp family transcriptional regulator